MNQQDLTRAIAERFFFTQALSREVIKFTLDQIKDGLNREERICLQGLGSFSKETRESRKVRHPKTGKIITIPRTITVDFNPSRILLKDLK